MVGPADAIRVVLDWPITRWDAEEHADAVAALDALLAEIQQLREALKAGERALADAEKIIEARSGKGSWVGSLNLVRVRAALARVEKNAAITSVYTTEDED